jgi:hypothetical protein
MCVQCVAATAAASFRWRCGAKCWFTSLCVQSPQYNVMVIYTLTRARLSRKLLFSLLETEQHNAALVLSRRRLFLSLIHKNKPT